MESRPTEARRKLGWRPTLSPSDSPVRTPPTMLGCDPDTDCSALPAGTGPPPHLRPAVPAPCRKEGREALCLCDWTGAELSRELFVKAVCRVFGHSVTPSLQRA